MAQPFVIVGAGHAGLSLATTLRRKGWRDDILLLERQAGIPVQRPPLSKSALKDDWSEGKNHILPAEWFEKQNVELMAATAVVAVDRLERIVKTDHGQTIVWSKLALATGATPRRLSCPGHHLEGVHYVRTVGDASALRQDLRAVERAVVVGGGYIGLEVAACLAGMGKSVTGIELADRLLARVATPQMSAFFQELHLSRGISVLTGDGVARIEGGPRVERVTTMAGQVVKADAVIAGIGVMPDLALLPFLEIDGADGIPVDAHCMTRHPGIYAVGDIARLAWPFGRMRIESVCNAQYTAALAAHHALGLEPPEYEVPWFWSDQHDGKLQSAGVPLSWDHVIWRKGDRPDSGAAFAFRDGELVSVEAFNFMAAYMLGKKMMSGASGATMADVGDRGIDLRALTKLRCTQPVGRLEN